MSDKSNILELNNGFLEVKIKPDAFALGRCFASLDSGDQFRFLKGFVSEFEGFKSQWAVQASYIADKANNGNLGVGGASAYKPLIVYYLQTLLEQLEEKPNETTR